VEPAIDALSRRLIQSERTLSPELRRAAHWIASHPPEVGLLSMREQARRASVSPATMVRLARALGFSDFAALRRPFQQGLMQGHASLVGGVQSLQSTEGRPRLAALQAAQAANIESVAALNVPAKMAAAARCLLESRRVAALGLRASYGIAWQFHYAYHLIRGNGVLLDDTGDTLFDRIELLGAEDAVVAISLAPYTRRTIEAAQAARERRAAVIALTDGMASPLVRIARHTLVFRAESASYFHSMTGALALAEMLLAHVAALGGKSVVRRLASVERRLAARRAYWQPGRTEATLSGRSP
jgi:DNA-binding MurR/RpiR family transcriptional regulator